MQKRDFIPTGSLNTDFAYGKVPEGDYINVVGADIVIGDDGNSFSISNMTSNSLVEESYTLSGMRVHGEVEDIKNNRVFYFVSSTKKGVVLCYRRKENDILLVIDENNVNGGLGLSYVRYIDSILVGDNLIFCAGDFGIFKVNVERALAANNPGYISPDGTTATPYTYPLEWEEISLIKPAGIFPPVVNKYNDSSFSGDFISEKTFMFAYMFEYESGERSVLSPHSKLIKYNNPDIPEDYNAIKVSLPKEQRIWSTVSKVHILAKEGISNEFSIIYTFDRDEDETPFSHHNGTGDPMGIIFHNDINGVALSESDSLKPFDSVPVRAEAIEVARNRVLLGNITEGYDLMPIDNVTATIVEQSNGSSLVGEYVFVHSECDDDPGTPNPPEVTDVVVVKISGTGDPNIDGWYEYSFNYTYQEFIDGDLPVVISLSSGQRIGALSDFILDQDFLNYYSSGCPPNDINLTGFVDYSYPGTQPTVIGLTGAITGTEGLSVFKENSIYVVGILFYDFAGRHNGVVTNAALRVYTNKRTYNNVTYNTGIKWTLPSGYVSWIPEWATYYEIVRSKNLKYDFFIQHLCETIKYVSKDDSGVYQYSDTYTQGTTIGIAWDLTRFVESGMGYIYQAGDLLRVFPNDDSDELILSITDQQGKWVITEGRDLGDISAANVFEPCIIEIYTPHFRLENEFFYGVGHVYKILSPGGPNRSFETVEGILEGDVVLKERDFSGAGLFFECMSPDDKFYKDWITDIGKPSIGYSDGQKKLETAIRYSNTFINDTNINGTSTFDALDIEILDDTLGPIRRCVRTNKLQEEGSILLVIGETNTVSVYLGETQVVDNSGQTLIASSGNFIGTINPLRGRYGTKHPESVRRHKGKVYFFDITNGDVVRYNLNGLTPISDHKVRTYFKRMSNAYLSSGNDFFMPGGFNGRTNQYWLYMPEISTGHEVYYEDYIERFASGAFGTDPVSYDIYLNAGQDYYIDLNFYTETNNTITLFVDGTEVLNETIEGTYNYYTFTPPVSGYLSILAGDRGYFTLSTWIKACHNIYSEEDKVVMFRDVDGAVGWCNTLPISVDLFSQVGDLLISFSGGKCYPHNGDSFNNFFGDNIPTKISFLINNPLKVVKMPMAIDVISNDAPFRVMLRTYNPEQATDIVSNDFVEIEGNYHAAFLMDRLDPNVSGDFDVKLYKGSRLRNNIIIVCVEFRNFADELSCELISIGWKSSSGHNI